MDINLINKEVKMKENIKPSHYKLTVKGLNIEVIDIINASNISYNMGTAFAYLLRAGKKRNCSYQEDILKAIKHLEFELEKIDIYGLLPIVYPIVIKGQEIEPLDIIDSCNLQFMQEACIFKMLSTQPDLYTYKKDVNTLISMLKLSLKGDEE
jgi:predicted transcriptional regulator